jgi:hypothetical protein
MKPSNVLRIGEAAIYLPTIAATELYYLFEKKGCLECWNRLDSEMSKASGFTYCPFNEKVLKLFRLTKAKEIHDKIIISKVKALKADALITKDVDLMRLKEANILWP